MAKRRPEPEVDTTLLDIPLAEQGIEAPTVKRPSEEPSIPLTPENLRASQDIMERIAAVRKAIKRTEGPAKWLDKYRLDPLLGWFFADFFGDIATTCASLWIVYEGHKAGLPPGKIARMLANVGVDFGIDIIPFLGSFVDWFFRANVKNVNIMKKYAEELEEKARKQGKTV